MGHSDQDMLIKDEAQRILNSGVRNLWYPVAPSWHLGNAPIGITRLGDQIVLWRDGQGDRKSVV